jgi:5'-phosphate synthase pdxT subunit
MNGLTNADDAQTLGAEVVSVGNWATETLVGGDHAGAGLGVGVLALQGDFREHQRMLEALGARTVAVRSAAQLDGLNGLVIPGGESTTMGKLMVEYGLIEAIRDFAASGRPIYGTCAGLIVLARATVESYDQPLLGLIDIVARRNAFGRQVKSFEVNLVVDGLGPEPLRAVFIRSPWIEQAGPGVHVLAEYDGHGVAAKQGSILVTAFHPELTSDTRVHRRFLEMVRAAQGSRGARQPEFTQPEARQPEVRQPESAKVV